MYGLVNGDGCIWTGRGRGRGVGVGVWGVESNPGRRRVGWRRRTQSDLVEGDAEEEAAEEGEAEGTTPTDIDRTPNQKITFFKPPLPPPPPTFNGGGSHFFQRSIYLLLQKLLLKTQNKMNTWEHQQNTQTKTCKS